MVYEYYRRAKRAQVLNKYDRWRIMAREAKLSREGLVRLEWMVFFEIKALSDVGLVCRHFGIGKSTFYKWRKRFNELNLRCLENLSSEPKRRRGRMAMPKWDGRIIALRKKYPYFGKMKLQVLYETMYDEKMTTWYIQRVIETYKLYFKKEKKKRTRSKRSIVKKKIRDCERKPETGFLIHLDTIVLHLAGVKRYIVTGIDDHSKMAYARMYTNHSSASAKDFFQRLDYLLEEKVKNVHTDNGSEFHKHFDNALQALSLTHWWSRVHTPKDNASNERFNRTLKEEFLSWGNFHPDPTIFNKKLTDWLVEYNSIRPHQSLNYLTPIQFAEKTILLSTTWSSSTSH